MLSVTRHVGESVRIGDRIEVKVLEIQGRKVRLGIEAPRDVRIARPEAPAPGKAAPPPK